MNKRAAKPTTTIAEMKQELEKQIVIYDGSFGPGPKFFLSRAVWNAKTVTFSDTGGRGRCLRRTQLFAIATPDLAVEAKAINDAADKLANRARAFREKLRGAAPK